MRNWLLELVGIVIAQWESFGSRCSCWESQWAITIGWQCSGWWKGSIILCICCRGFNSHLWCIQVRGGTMHGAGIQEGKWKQAILSYYIRWIHPWACWKHSSVGDVFGKIGCDPARWFDLSDGLDFYLTKIGHYDESMSMNYEGKMGGKVKWILFIWLYLDEKCLHDTKYFVGNHDITMANKVTLHFDSRFSTTALCKSWLASVEKRDLDVGFLQAFSRVSKTMHLDSGLSHAVFDGKHVWCILLSRSGSELPTTRDSPHFAWRAAAQCTRKMKTRFGEPNLGMNRDLEVEKRNHIGCSFIPRKRDSSHIRRMVNIIELQYN